MRDAHRVLAGAVAIGDALARGQEGFPGNAGRIVDPRFLRLGVAAGGLALLDDVAAGLAQAGVHLAQFAGILDLDAEMVEAGFAAPRRDREIHPRIVQHPFGVVRLHHGGPGREQRRVEADGLRNVADGHVHMQALHRSSSVFDVLISDRYFPWQMKPGHAVTFFRLETTAGLHSTAGAQGAPPQQFSVR